ncbi:MAG: Smr/MutS family protein [Myxococcota bacterium]
MSGVSTIASDRVELPVIARAVAARTRTPLGEVRALALAPLPTLAEARARIETVREARVVLERGEDPPVAGATDVSAAVELAKKGAILDSPQLRAAANAMRASSAVHRFLLAKEDFAPLLYGIGASMEDLSRPAEDILVSFAPDGTLADDASPDLGPLRRRLRQLHDAIKEKLSEILANADIRPYLMESYFTVRADRYVLPVRSSFQNQVKGIVHDASGSGQTVFIEPTAILELGNRLKIAHSEVLEEEQRILADLTSIVVEMAEPLAANLSSLALVDLVFASARLAIALFAEPIIPDERPGFDLIDARHPELLLQKVERPELEVVGNDLGLKDGQTVLILTGPNTGGKTVAMKTIGLFATMARAGLHLPCGPRSRIGWYERIEAAIGDDQSIATNLSTFAAHMRQIMMILDRASPGTLVLLDEIAADTDPLQGQALAQAVLEALADRGAHVVVTTHFERLKVIPFADARFRNAGVGFDPVRLKPTYRVSLDVPQSSSGLDIAQSLGVPSSIVDRARSLTGEGNEALEALMKSLRTKQVELDHEKYKAKEAFDRLVASRNELEDRKAALEVERKRVLAEVRSGLVEEIKVAREEVRTVIAKLQKAAGSDSVREAMRLATEAAAKLAHAEAEEAAKAAPLAGSGRPKEAVSGVSVGDWVHVDKLEKDGEVVQVEGKEALVAVGNMRTRVPISSLSVAQTKRPKRGTLHEAKKAAEQRAQREEVLSVELDLRGLAVDEALARIDAFLDVHYRGPTGRVRIIHGHGSGALKQAVRDHLKRSGYVKGQRPGDEKEGGDGATVVDLA